MRPGEHTSTTGQVESTGVAGSTSRLSFPSVVTTVGKDTIVLFLRADLGVESFPSS